MGFFDKRILNVLRDGKPRDFHQLLKEVGFSHNTLRLHLRRLVDQGLIVKEKKPSKDWEDPDSPILHLQSFIVKPLDSSQTPSVKSSLSLSES